MLQSSQNAQEMCRNDFRKSFIILFFMIFENFQHFGIQGLTSGPDLGIFEILDQKCVGYAICIEDMTHLGAAATNLDHTGSISYVLELFSAIFGKFNFCTNF